MDGWTGGKAYLSAKIPRWEGDILSRGIFALWDASKSVLLNAFAVLVYPNDHTLSSCWGIIFADVAHENGLQNLSKNGILSLPSYIPDGERGCFLCVIFQNFSCLSERAWSATMSASGLTDSWRDGKHFLRKKIPQKRVSSSLRGIFLQMFL